MPMKELNLRDRERVQEYVQAIESGDFNSDQVENLLKRLRFSGNTLVTDLANFTTHSHGRNDGDSFKKAREFATRAIRIWEAPIRAAPDAKPDPPYTGERIVLELLKLLSSLGFEVDEARFRKSGDQVVRCIQGAVEETPLEIDDHRLLAAWVGRMTPRALIKHAPEITGKDMSKRMNEMILPESLPGLDGENIYVVIVINAGALKPGGPVSRSEGGSGGIMMQYEFIVV